MNRVAAGVDVNLNVNVKEASSVITSYAYPCVVFKSERKKTERKEHQVLNQPINLP